VGNARPVAPERFGLAQPALSSVVFAASPDHIVVVRADDGRLVAANPAFEQATGYRLEEIVGRSEAELGIWLIPGERERFVSDVRRAHSVRDRQVLLRSQDGRVLSGRISASLVEHDGERLIVRVMRDVTEAKRLERRARRSERKFAALFETSPTGLVVVRSSERRVTEINDAALRLLDLARADATGALLAELIPLDQQDAGGVVRLARRDGQTVDALLSRAAVEIDGEPCEVLSLLDVTEQRRMERELERMVRERTAQLEEANRELESYNFSVSHDLRQPLNAIGGFAELLQDGIEGADRDDCLREIAANAARMEQMLDALMWLSRAGRGALDPVPVDMQELVASVVRDIAAGAPHTASIEVGELPPACGDPVLLRQVWVNLVGNAVKYSRYSAQPRIEIGGARRGPRVEYAIRDNGVGFDMDDAERLFGAFQRLPSAARFEGSGVGLAIVQRIIRRHGGRIDAESAPGRGATFRISLPGEVR
jgi:PAS domain S-box-containing protein